MSIILQHRVIHLLAVVGIASTVQLEFTVLHIAETKPPLCCLNKSRDGKKRKHLFELYLESFESCGLHKIHITLKILEQLVSHV